MSKFRAQRKVFRKQFCFIRCKRQHLVQMIGIVDLPSLGTLLAIPKKLQKPSFWEAIDSCFISINKFGSSKNPFEAITSLSEFHFTCRIFILLTNTIFFWSLVRWESSQDIYQKSFQRKIQLKQIDVIKLILMLHEFKVFTDSDEKTVFLNLHNTFK